MQFNSLLFLGFAPVVILLYYLVPRRAKSGYLLLASLLFYASFGLPSLFVLLGIITVTAVSAWMLSKQRSKPVFLVSVILLAGLLASIRFMNRAENTWFGLPVSFSLFVPVGLSFFTLNAIGYLSDLYTGKLEDVLSPVETALFLCFFPTVTSGPILRAGTFRDELRKEPVPFRYETIRKAAVWILWGYFLKLAVAERCALLSSTVYGDPSVHGLPVWIAIAAYSIQIYADFAGYSLIAKGLAYGMGIRIPDNFHQPYLSGSVKEFWRRWHISLSSWLKDYVYIPLGGSRKGVMRTRINLMITFLISGFWHGTGLVFLVWGFLHGLFQIAEGILMKKGHTAPQRFSSRLFHTALTFFLVSIAWVFFRSYGVREAAGILVRACRPGNAGILFTDGLYSLGLDARNFRMLAAALLIMTAADVRQYSHGDVTERFFAQSIVLRIMTVWVLLAFVVLSVNLSGAEFIYMQF